MTRATRHAARRMLYAFVLLLVVPVRTSWSQADHPISPAAQPQLQPRTITIGRSVVALNGPWRFHVGDDARWADPDFDDSAWETVDLTPPAGAHDPAVVFLSAGLFAQEVSVLHIPGIWFPFGVGVSRTQFVYMAFDVLLFALLLRRLLRFAAEYGTRAAMDGARVA